MTMGPVMARFATASPDTLRANQIELTLVSDLLIAASASGTSCFVASAVHTKGCELPR